MNGIERVFDAAFMVVFDVFFLVLAVILVFATIRSFWGGVK